MLCYHLLSLKYFQTWMNVFVLLNTKEDIQRKITEQFWGTIDYCSIYFPTMEVNGAPKQPGYKLSSKISSFVFSRTNKFIQVWNYLRVRKWWQNFLFWVNYPFKIVFLNTKHMRWFSRVLCYINCRCSVCLPWCRWHQTLLWWGSGALLRISGVFHICLGAHGPHRNPILPLWLGGLWQVCAVCGLQPGLVYSILRSVEEMQLYVSVRVGNSEPEKSVWRTESWIPRSSRI